MTSGSLLDLTDTSETIPDVTNPEAGVVYLIDLTDIWNYDAGTSPAAAVAHLIDLTALFQNTDFPKILKNSGSLSWLFDTPETCQAWPALPTRHYSIDSTDIWNKSGIINSSQPKFLSTSLIRQTSETDV